MYLTDVLIGLYASVNLLGDRHSSSFYLLYLKSTQQYINTHTKQMGANCTGCGKEKKGKQQFCDFTVEPSDTWQFQPTRKPNLPQIKFQGLLSGIKVYNCPQESISLKFIIEDILEALLPRKIKSQQSNEIKWKSKESFDFVLNQYQLRKKFLEIQSTDERGRVISSMKINLYYIATGPYHHDFRFKLKKLESRLQFDLKISQIIQTKVGFNKVEMHLNKKFFEAETLYFNVRILRAQALTSFESDSSYTQTLALEQPNLREPFNGEIDECQSPIRFRNKNKLFLTENTKIIWNKDKGEMPNFKIYMKASDMKESLLHFVVWKTSGQQDAVLFGDSHIPAYKLYIENQQTLKEKEGKLCYQNENDVQARSICLTDDSLTLNGDHIGEIKLNINIENNKYIKQMKACARTQKGVIPMVPLVNMYGVNFQNKKDKLSALGELVNNIQKMNMTINQSMGTDLQHSASIRRKMLNHFENLRLNLESTLQQSYILVTDEQMPRNIQDQIFLLSLIQKLEVFLEDDEVFTDICWHIILAIIKRGEFSLPNIGFRKKQIQQMGKEKISANLKKKIKVGLQFQEILYRIFLQSLLLGYKQGRQKPKPAIETFKAYCYFRIPAFRDILLKMVVRKEDDTVQWKTDNFDVDLQFMKETQDVLVFEIDWELSFYKPLSTEPKSQSLNKQLIENIEGNVWLGQVAKRGSTFFYFLHFLVQRLLELGKKIKFIKWQYFPGYNKLVKSFLFEMRKLRVSSYPKSLLQTSINLLSNQKLINIMVTIVFEKTNIYDCNQLMKGLQIINRYFKFLTKQKKLLPPTFNYVYFFKGLKNILEGDFSYGIIRTIGIIYNYYQNFNIEFRKTLSLYILGKVFFKLFLNWSHSVRSFFYHLLVLKISRSSDVFNSECRKQFANRHQLMNEITTRYDHVIKLVRNANNIQIDEKSKNQFRRQQKDVFKAMKKRMNQKKKKQRVYQRKESRSQMKKMSLFDKPTNQQDHSHDKTKFTVDQLNKRNNMQRSYSAVIDIETIKLLQKKAQNHPNKDNDTKEEEEQTINRIKSSTQQTEGEQTWKDSNLKPQKKRVRRMSFYNEDDFQIRDMTEKEVEYLPIALKQFEELDQAIRKYLVQNGELPTCDLQGFQIPYDEDIKPSTMAIDQWQPMTNTLQ